MTNAIPTAQWEQFQTEVLEKANETVEVYYCGACACAYLPMYEAEEVYADRFVPSTDVDHDCKCHNFESPFPDE